MPSPYPDWIGSVSSAANVFTDTPPEGLMRESIAYIVAVLAIVFRVAMAGAKPPTLPAMPDTTPPGKPHFDTEGAKVGEQLPAVMVYSLRGKPLLLERAWEEHARRGMHATLLITASYTCPKSRGTYPQAAAMSKLLEGKVGLTFIYVVEAHPAIDPSPYSGVEDVKHQNQLDHVLCRQPRTLQQRIDLAMQFRKRLTVAAPILIDSMDNLAWKSIGGGPNMGVLVDENGIVLARQGWFDAESMKRAAQAFIAVSQETAATRPLVIGEPAEADAARHGDLVAVKAQLAKMPGLARKVLSFEPRGLAGDRTLLHYAIDPDDFQDGPHLEIAKLLIQQGADVNLQTDHVPTPLHLAAKRGSLDIAKLLVERGADVNARAHDYGPTPLQESLIYGHQDVAEFLVQSGAKSNFFTEVARGDVQGVDAKISTDPSIILRPDGFGRPPLAYAAAAGQLRMAEHLLAAGARDVPRDFYRNRDDRTAICWAVRTKNLAMIRLLCEAGDDPNLVNDAVKADALDVLRELLAHHADLNHEDMSGFGPLHYAAMEDQSDMARALLAAGADANAPTAIDLGPCGSGSSQMETPLHLAAQMGSQDMVRLLIRYGAKVASLDAAAKTPLHLAARGSDDPAKVVAVMKALLAAKAEINAKDFAGQTPLDDAIDASQYADHPDPAVVQFLKAHGAKPGASVAGPNPAGPVSPAGYSPYTAQEPEHDLDPSDEQQP